MMHDTIVDLTEPAEPACAFLERHRMYVELEDCRHWAGNVCASLRIRMPGGTEDSVFQVTYRYGNEAPAGFGKSKGEAIAKLCENISQARLSVWRRRRFLPDVRLFDVRVSKLAPPDAGAIQ